MTHFAFSVLAVAAGGVTGALLATLIVRIVKDLMR